MRITSVALAALLALGGANALKAQGSRVSPDGLWEDIPLPQRAPGAPNPWSGLRGYRLTRLEQAGMKRSLAAAPGEAIVHARHSRAVITLPMPDGSYQRFSYVASSVMAPELARKFPEIKTYVGQGLDDPSASVRFDWTPAGFHAFVLSSGSTVVVNPYTRGQTDLYVSFYRSDVSAEAAAWTCYTDDETGPLQSDPPMRSGSSGGDLRIYRIAVATTGEYTQYHGGTVSQALAAVTTAVNRISGIFEREFAIRLQLVANNNLIIYTNAATDPYTGNNNSTMMSENQDNLDAVIGSANYDIGHVFSTAGGGVTFPGIACLTGWKAKAASGLGNPIGDAFVVEIAAHEMGHQFGSHHTWNGSNGNCSADQWGSETACEPGSGSTIMSYAGLCGVDNLQSARDYYYHAISYEKIRDYITTGSGGGCPTITPTGNTPPNVNAGPNYTIPYGTPFVLTATGSDPDGDALTYCWEQVDLGPRAALSAGDNGSSPIFRSWLPTTSPSRTFPRLTDLLNNTTPKGELLPTTSRTLLMRCTVRDNRAGGGGVDTDDTMLTVTSSAGPFRVTSPNAAVNWSGSGTVTWNVASTNLSPVSCSQVNIRLSVDGGLTYPYLLVSNTPNDGSQGVTLPDLSSTQARIKVEAVGNIFFDVSDANFSFTCPGPAIATNVTASDGTSAYVEVTWTLPSGGSTGLSHCQILRSTNTQGASLLEDNWTTTTYQDSSCLPGVTYYYWIKVVNLCGGVSSFSAYDAGWRVLAPPAAVAASDGEFSSMVRVTWDESPGATHYRLYRNTTNNTVTATALTPWMTTRLWSDSDATPGALYYYWVQAATGSSGETPSDFSAYNTGWRPLMPPTVTASDGTSTEHVLVQWDEPVGANYYCVYRHLSNDPTQATALTAWITSSSYTDTTAVTGVPYYYWVKAAGAAGGVRPSDFSSADVGWKAYQAPTNVVATDGTDTARVLVSWDAVPMATYYRVYRSLTNDPGTATELGSWQTGVSYSDQGATPGFDYYYWIKAAAGSAGERPSEFSAGDAGWRALSPPTGTAATDGDFAAYVRITWELSGGDAWYRVYRGTVLNPKLAGGIGNWSQNATSYNDTTATPGATYYYWVKVATDGSGTHASIVSNMDTGWRALAAPTTTASNGTYVDRVAVGWSAVAGATHYRVFRATTNIAAASTPISDWLTTPPFDDTTAVPGTGYFYWVRAAVNAEGEHPSGFGAPVKGARAKDCDNNGVPDADDPDEDGDRVPDGCDLCPGTLAGATVHADGCQILVRPDFDADGDVDADDFAAFAVCASGAAVPCSPQCEPKDFDLDHDVDMDDFAVFQRCYSGQNRAARLTCDD